MSKYPKLLNSVVCQWELASGHICGEAFHDVALFSDHVNEHVTVGDGEAEECCWIGCDFSSPNHQEFITHVLFHPYHSYLKLVGTELLERAELPMCQLDEETVNNTPLLKAELKCLWIVEEGGEEGGGECMSLFDSIGEFYGHVHSHAMAETNLGCRWKGTVRWRILA